MRTANKVSYVSTQWNTNVNHTTVSVEVTLDNGDVVNEEYAFLGLESADLVPGRVYAVMGYTDNPVHRAAVGFHPVSATRFAVARGTDTKALLSVLVDPLNASDVVLMHGLKVYAFCTMDQFPETWA